MINKWMLMETSKKILAGSWAAAITLTIIVTVGDLSGRDMTHTGAIALASWAELAAAHGFYYWKAKNENRAKGVQKLIRYLAKKYDVEVAARFAEIIYKD